MITDELLQRINTLARKQKTEGLSPKEKAEQAHLRSLYLGAIRSQVKEQLDRVRFVDQDDK